jgi:large subunit ribosomal protein L21
MPGIHPIALRAFQRPIDKSGARGLTVCRYGAAVSPRFSFALPAQKHRSNCQEAGPQRIAPESCRLFGSLHAKIRESRARTQEKTMFAVIRTGGKQYSVSAGDIITVMALDGAPGDKVTFDDVLFVSGDAPKIGAPTVAGASVSGEIVEQTRSPKSIAFKKRRRQNSKRKRGHRQDLTLVKILSI